jgi:hypothetical protein
MKTPQTWKEGPTVRISGKSKPKMQGSRRELRRQLKSWDVSIPGIPTFNKGMTPDST